MENNEAIVVQPPFVAAVNADKILGRSSQVYKLATEPKAKVDKDAGNLSATAKELCIEMFMWAKYGRKPEEIKSKYLDKGNEREEDALTLISRVHGKMYKKNTVRLYNNFLTGEPDCFLGQSIQQAETIIDAKTCWSMGTFLESKEKALEPAYRFQGHSYMDLTGAQQHIVARCLVNGTAAAINDEKRRLSWKMGIIDMEATDNESFFEKCRQIEVNHIFDMFAFKEENPNFDFHNDLSAWNYDVPMKERLFTFTIDRDEAEIQRIHAIVMKARAHINKNLFGIEN